MPRSKSKSDRTTPTSSPSPAPSHPVPAVRLAAPPKEPAKAVIKGKLGVLVDLLRRPAGARMGELTAATGWQAHSVRGAIAGALKTKRKIMVLSEKSDGGRVYRIADKVG